MKNHIKNLILSGLLFTLLFASSCEKIVEVSAPKDRIIAQEVFLDDATATSAVLGLYQDMTNLNGAVGNFGLSLYPSLSAGEISRTSSIAVYDEFSNNALTSSNSLLSTYIWNKAYNLIFQANSVIQGLESSGSVSAAVKVQLTGEAKFIRAFYHFYLYNLFGPVPLITTIEYKQSSAVGRSSKEELYAQILSDLLDAKNTLSATYASTGRVRVNKWAATALLSRVYLYLEKWDDAYQASNELIASNQYSLVSNLNNVFLAGSNEAIFQLLPTGAITATTINTWDGNTFIPASGSVPQYRISASLLNLFTAGDQRRTLWVNSTVVSNVSYSYPYKYKVKNGSSISEYYMFLRYAEILLIRAEAAAQLGNLSSAITDLDLIRKRAGTPLASVQSPDISKEELIKLILIERQKEFFCEMGHRWLDLKRTGTIDLVMREIKSTWLSAYSLYPIPFNELIRNPLLTQNPGYN